MTAVNEFLKAIFNEDGLVNEDALDFIPPYFADLEEKTEYLYNVLSYMKLPLDFIKEHYLNLNPLRLIKNNELPVVFLRNEAFSYLMTHVIHELSHHGHSHLFEGLVSMDYGTTFNHQLLSELMLYFDTEGVDESVSEYFSNILHAIVDYVDKDFIMNNIGENGFSILTAFMRRTESDITLAELIENVDKIEMGEILIYIDAYKELAERRQAEAESRLAFREALDDDTELRLDRDETNDYFVTSSGEVIENELSQDVLDYDNIVKGHVEEDPRDAMFTPEKEDALYKLLAVKALKETNAHVDKRNNA